MWSQKADVEVGGYSRLYPTMQESPDQRWAFIRKVYLVISIQLLLTASVNAAIVTVHPILHFFIATRAGFALSILFLITPLIVMWPLYWYSRKHPVNYILLAIFTVSQAFLVALSCFLTNGKVILESVVLTAAVVVSLTLYTFWAAKRGHDFNFLGPFLCGSLVVLILSAFIQIMFPPGKTSDMIYGCLVSIIFCAYIVYDTDHLIKRYNYDDFILAAISLYLDILNLFLHLLALFKDADRYKCRKFTL